MGKFILRSRNVLQGLKISQDRLRLQLRIKRSGQFFHGITTEIRIMRTGLFMITEKK